MLINSLYTQRGCTILSSKAQMLWIDSFYFPIITERVAELSGVSPDHFTLYWIVTNIKEPLFQTLSQLT